MKKFEFERWDRYTSAIDVEYNCNVGDYTVSVTFYDDMTCVISTNYHYAIDIRNHVELPWENTKESVAEILKRAKNTSH